MVWVYYAIPTDSSNHQTSFDLEVLQQPAANLHVGHWPWGHPWKPQRKKSQWQSTITWYGIQGGIILKVCISCCYNSIRLMKQLSWMNLPTQGHLLNYSHFKILLNHLYISYQPPSQGLYHIRKQHLPISPPNISMSHGASSSGIPLARHSAAHSVLVCTTHTSASACRAEADQRGSWFVSRLEAVFLYMLTDVPCFICNRYNILCPKNKRHITINVPIFQIWWI